MPADIPYMIQECAKIGTLVYHMDQANTAPLSEDAPGPWGAGNIADGYCAGLAVRWIRLSYAGKDFLPGDSESGGVPIKYFDGTDWQATAYQNRLNDFAATGTTRRTRAQYALSVAQMALGNLNEGSESTGANGQRLSRVIARSYGCYYTALAAEGYGHAIAFRHARPRSGSGPGEFHIFDANVGHFMWTAKGSTWPGIIDWYFKSTGYADEYTKAYFIARATPPVSG